MSAPPRVPNPLFLALTAALLLTMGALQFHTASLEAQTYDEAVHLTAGYSYWATADYRLNQEHPPLAKLLCAAPLLAMGLRFDTSSPHWSLPDQSEMGRLFLYSNTRPAGAILAAARSVTIALSLALGLSLALWLRPRFGEPAALAALALYTLDPNFLAHGRYVTTDVAVTLFSFLSVITWLAFLEHGRKRWLALAALTLGLAMASKFSGFYVLPIHAALLALQAVRRRISWPKALAALPLLCAGAILVCAATYGSHTLNVPAWREHKYVTGILELRQHNTGGHRSYLLGKVNTHGDPRYFPVAFAVKTPEVTLLALLAALLLLPRILRRHEALLWLALLLYPALYFGISVAGNINIGVRHLLPMYPFLFALIAAAISALPRRAALAAPALLFAGILSAQPAIYPDYLAYFNRFAGGPADGHRYLLDSNLDWGQDVIKLKRYMDAHGIEFVQVAYFGMADLNHYGIRHGGLPGANEPHEIDKLDNWVAASVTDVYDVYFDQPTFHWLQRYTPAARIGWSLYLYDLRQSTIPAGKRPLPPAPKPAAPPPTAPPGAP